MTRTDLAEWRVDVHLTTNGYRTVIDELRIRPSQSATILGMRGHLDLPTGTNPTHPTWIRLNLPTARRHASAALRELLAEEQNTNEQRWSQMEHQGVRIAAPGAAPDHARTARDRREPIERVAALQARFAGFTPTNTTHRTRRTLAEHAIVAAAYAIAIQNHPTRPREPTILMLTQADITITFTQIGALLTRIRRDGLLTATQPGKAGGQLTPKARQILTETGFSAPWYPPTGKAPGT
jgi:hypothetical protein